MSDTLSHPLLTGDAALLARRYAEALFDLAVAANQQDVVASELDALQNLISESADFRELICTPRLSREAAMALIKTVAAAAHLGSLTSNFLGLLGKNRRLSLLGGMADAYGVLLATSRGERRVEVQVARPLDPAQKQRLIAGLEGATGNKIQLILREVPALLGGLIVKVGSRQIDASLRGKLARLERQLKSNQEAA